MNTQRNSLLLYSHNLPSFHLFASSSYHHFSPFNLDKKNLSVFSKNFLLLRKASYLQQTFVSLNGSEWSCDLISLFDDLLIIIKFIVSFLFFLSTNSICASQKNNYRFSNITYLIYICMSKYHATQYL